MYLNPIQNFLEETIPNIIPILKAMLPMIALLIITKVVMIILNKIYS